MPEAYYIKSGQWDDFTLLQLIYFLLFRDQVCDQRLFAFRQSIDLEALNVCLLFFDHLVNTLWISVLLR